jgi:GntR family transcriptional regulator/MocR family aminotransferase
MASYTLLCARSPSTLSRFEQQTLRLFIQRGLYARHLRRVGSVYRKRRNLLIECFAHCPGVRLSGDDAWLHCLMTVDSLSEQALIARAAARGVKVRGLSEYAQEAVVPPSTLVVGYAGLNEDQIREAAAILHSAWALNPPG